MRSSAPVIAGAGGKRSGKTVTAQIGAAYGVRASRLQGPGHVGELGFGASLPDRACRSARESKIASSAVVDEQATRISFQNGAQIIALAPTPGQLRGDGRKVRMVIIDEAGFCPPSIWRDARYVLLDHHDEGAQARLIGSPVG